MVTLDKTPVDGGFSDFFALEKIKLVGECANFERAVLSSRAPPNLKTLAVECEAPLAVWGSNWHTSSPSSEHAIDYAPFFRAPSSGAPKTFEKLELTFTDDPTDDQHLIVDLAKDLGAIGAKVIVSVKEYKSFFPPYLDGEDMPEEEVYFDGEAIVS